MLFVLIGLEVLVLSHRHVSGGGALAVPVVLLARLVSVAVPVFLPRQALLRAQTVRVLTWGGLRGGMSVALALSLPETPYRNTLVMMTYGCVLFAIAVQGLTVSKLIR